MTTQNDTGKWPKPDNLSPHAWNYMIKIARDIWASHENGSDWKNKVLISCKEFYQLLLDDQGKLILSKSELLRFANNAHIRNWSNELLMEGLNLMHNREYELAINKLQLHLMMDPDSASGYAKLAECESATGQWRSALTNWNHALMRAPKEASYYEGRAQVYSFLDQDEKALDDLNFALLLNRRLASAFAARAVIFQSRQQFVDALKEIDQALKLNPANQEFKLMQAAIYLAMNKLPMAYKIYRQILAEDPFNIEAIFRRALIKVECDIEVASAEDDLILARSLGHPLAEKYLLDWFYPGSDLGIQNAA
ncbi:hypothetical protein KFE98_13080 [bacterium SCSIO 12741]|nr:hypothetical protein KFE98_13080 [bacterium SCSIO 12741]